MRPLLGSVPEQRRGEIELEVVDPKTNKSQIHAFPNGKAYDLSTIARFLGWVKASGQATDSCRIAFDAYQSEATTGAGLRGMKITLDGYLDTDILRP